MFYTVIRFKNIIVLFPFPGARIFVQYDDKNIYIIYTITVDPPSRYDITHTSQKKYTFYKNITVYEYTVIYYIIHAVSKTQYYYPPLYSLHKSDFPISTKNTCCTREYAQSKSVVIEGVVACRRCTLRNTNEVRVCTTVTLNFLFQYTY